VESIAHPLNKTDDQIHGGNISLCLEGEEQNIELKKLALGWDDSAVLWGKPGIVLPWRNQEKVETDSLTKQKAHL
jgi:hypothetical protein